MTTKTTNSTWQPIETAPKDGTWILIGGGRVDTSNWYGTKSEPTMVVAIWEDGWFFADWDGALRSEYLMPTSWMELPNAP